MEKSAKEAFVEEIKSLIVGKQSVVLTDYKGLTVAQMYEMRRAFDKAGAGYKVVKNTLARIAMQGTPYELLNEGLTGTIGIAYSDDPVAPAKVLSELVKKLDKLVVKIGYLDGKRLDPTDLDALSKLPSKDELRAKLLSVFNAPATKLVGVLAAVPRDFMGVLRARAEKLEG